MKISFNRKIISKIVSGLLIITFILPFSLIPTKKAKAVVFTDPTNLVQNTINALAAVGSAASEYSNQLKEYVLDPLANGLAKMIIRQLTNSIVNWINSGFEGSPAFLQNPGAFFLDMADQITGDFIAKVGGPLQDLCSPFSIDIRLALAFKYRPNSQQRYACTLGTIIKNSKNAVENASINGFTAGDFRQGGWPAFVSLTTEPQNNIYGAYLTAESDLSWRVASAQAQQKDEISAGKGFLSWRDPKCAAEVKKYNDDIKNERRKSSEQTEGSAKFTPLKSKNDCPVQTPGTVIVDSLESNLQGPLHELELADELGEIVNALFAQLTSQILQKGLSSVSQKDSSGSSYLDQTISEINQESNPQVQSVKADLIKNVDVYKKDTIEYKQIRDEALAIMLDIKNSYDSAKLCLNTRMNDATKTLSETQRQKILSEITAIDAVLASRVSTKTLDLLTLAQEADYRLKTLQEIQDQANNAKTLNDLNAPSQKYAQLVQSRSLTTPIEIQKAKENLELVKIESYDLKQDALRKMQACVALN